MPDNELFTIQSLHASGQGITHTPLGREVRLWNALPGEQVRARIIKKRAGVRYGIAEQILSPSKDRIEAKESHYASCSPLQILEYTAENAWKSAVIQDLFRDLVSPDTLSPIIAPDYPFGYRNKMEFNFMDHHGISPGFHERGSRRMVPAEGCALAAPIINKVAARIVNALRSVDFSHSLVKSLVLRTTKDNSVLGGLFLKEKRNLPKNVLDLDPQIKGFTVFYSNPESPASVPTEIVSSEGEEFLAETLLGQKFKFSLLSFLQVNIPLFETVLTRMQQLITSDDIVIDFYSGIGSIGLSLFPRSLTLVELDPYSIRCARENAALHGTPVTILESGSEDARTYITEDHTVIFDPPRAGLHPKIIEFLRTTKPKRIIYLSCNPETQVRDYNLLADIYAIAFLETYNFFPRTPHIESLIVLNKK